MTYGEWCWALCASWQPAFSPAMPLRYVEAAKIANEGVNVS